MSGIIEGLVAIEDFLRYLSESFHMRGTLAWSALRINLNQNMRMISRGRFAGVKVYNVKDFAGLIQI